MAGEHVSLPSIADLNDAFRRSGRDVYATPSVAALDSRDGLMESIRTYGFTPDNDPYGEHDFGAVDWEGERYFWKIDHYDQDLEYWHDPISPDCRRVLTVMLGSEY